MPKKNTNGKAKKSVETLRHAEALRKHIPTAEYQSVLSEEQQTPIQVAYARRNPDLDPQLVWRGKDMQDWSDLVVQAPPIYIQEKVHPKALIDDLRRQTEEQEKTGKPQQFDMFADFNGLPENADKTEFYQHDANWTNRMILGDSLQVMASLAGREGLRGQVHCIYIDPPYGIRFNSNFQWSTTSRDVKDGNQEHITREPEQVKAFRDTWRDGIHSYLSYLRDRLTIAHDLLANTGSIFIQIGDENVHRIRALMDEVFGEENFVSEIAFQTTSSRGADTIDAIYDILLWYSKSESRKIRKLYQKKGGSEGLGQFDFVLGENDELRKVNNYEEAQRLINELLAHTDTTSQGETASGDYHFNFKGSDFYPPKNRHWSQSEEGMKRLYKAGRLLQLGQRLRAIRYLRDNPVVQRSNMWTDTTFSGFGEQKTYVVQTLPEVIQRCILITTDPGDLVLDPTCGSGTTAYVAEQWGRRWITIDTSRVALALARARIMGARYPYYLLKDSYEGQLKEADLTRTIPSNEPRYGTVRQGFVYDRVPHITLKSIANNAEIDVIYATYHAKMEPIRGQFNKALNKTWEEWEIPREAEEIWSEEARRLHEEWWQLRIARQKEIDASIAAKADYEYLYDKPYEDNKKVRVAGPFTVESLSPHRTLGVDENDELIDNVAEGKAGYAPGQSFEQMILENLRTAGVQQAHKEDKINFFSLTPWPGHYICAEGRYMEGSEEKGRERRAGIFIGPEFGTVSRPDLVAAAREAGDAGFDVLVTCAFNYDARSTEFSKLGNIPVLKARMNADLHMADDLRNTGKGNLFVIFGEPDIEKIELPDGQIQIKINGVDVFHPGTGKVESNGPGEIACWFIDTDYNEESFFVRHAYFLGANDPYFSLKTTLKAEINEEAWESLNSDVSRPFDKPSSGRIAVKVINHLGDEVMKVFKVK
jgi:adenine-specific DNA-methyltransferase